MKTIAPCIALSFLIGATALAQKPADESLATAAAGTGTKTAAEIAKPVAPHQTLARAINKKCGHPLDFIDPVALLLDHNRKSQGKWNPDVMHWILATMLLSAENDRTLQRSNLNVAWRLKDTGEEEASQWALDRKNELTTLSYHLIDANADKVQEGLQEASQIIQKQKTDGTSTYDLETSKRSLQLVHLLIHGTTTDSFDTLEEAAFLKAWRDNRKKPSDDTTAAAPASTKN